MTKSKSVTLSIMLTAHREGLIAQKTLLSLQAATEQLKAHKISWELLIHVDNGDEITTDFLKNQDLLPADFYTNSFGELGASRNFLIDKARGTFVATIDADDLVNDMWFVDAVKFLQRHKSEDIVLHTNYSVNFGEKNVLWPKTNSLDVDTERLINASDNRWDSAIVARKELMQRFPFSKNEGGFAPEDWHFNSETLAAGVKHMVVPESTLFVRRKPESVMTRQAENASTVRYTDLLDIAAVRAIDSHATDDSQQHSSIAANPYVKAAKSQARASAFFAKKAVISAARRTSVGRKFVARAVEKKRGGPEAPAHPDVPNWLMEQWIAAHNHEKELFPSKSVLKDLIVYRTDTVKPRSIVFKKAVDALKTDTIDHLILVPWLKHGGADLLAIRYANELRKLYSAANIAVFATEADSESEWSHKLDDSISFVDFGNIAHMISEQERQAVLTRLMVQTKNRSVQIINSRLGYEWAERHKQLIREQNFNIYAAAYCQDVNYDGREVGYIHTHLPKIYDVTKKIISDNGETIRKLVAEYGFDPERFVAHYQPVKPLNEPIWHPPRKDEPFKLLWASRIAKQKRPDLIVAIAKELNKRGIDAHIEAYGVTNKGHPNVIEDAALENLKYMGPFSDFYSLPLSEYAAFTYTSDYDGMPNIVLEAVNAGIPLISSDVGGIHELIVHKKTGLIIENSVEAFADAIEARINMSEKQVTKLVAAGREALARQHNKAQYLDALKNAIEL